MCGVEPQSATEDIWEFYSGGKIWQIFLEADTVNIILQEMMEGHQLIIHLAQTTLSTWSPILSCIEEKVFTFHRNRTLFMLLGILFKRNQSCKLWKAFLANGFLLID